MRKKLGSIPSLLGALASCRATTTFQNVFVIFGFFGVEYLHGEPDVVGFLAKLVAHIHHVVAGILGGEAPRYFVI